MAAASVRADGSVASAANATPWAAPSAAKAIASSKESIVSRAEATVANGAGRPAIVNAASVTRMSAATSQAGRTNGAAGSPAPSPSGAGGGVSGAPVWGAGGA